MTQLSPSTLLSDQATVAIQKLLDDYKSGAVRDLDEITAKMRDVISDFTQNAGSPVSKYDPITHGEPPTSDKVNRAFGNLQQDINIMQRQTDFLRASTTYLFNVMSTEVALAKNEQNKLRNKLKTLELYSSDTDPTIVTFAEHFASDDYLDPDIISGSAASILENEYLALGRDGDLVNVGDTAIVRVLPESNGFVGNNLEARSDLTPTTDLYNKMFVAETVETDKVRALTDDTPNTMFEYSAYLVNEADRQTAKNLNFTYDDANSTSQIDWSKGPINSGVLRLALEFELSEVSSINYISVSPFGGANNSNHPIHVTKMQVSVDGTKWTVVDPKDIWITTNQNISSLRAADDISIGTTVWSFAMQDVRFVRLFIEQPNSIDAPIGHIYYVDNKTNARVEGPRPTITDPKKYYTVGSIASKDQTQKREILRGKKWFIGLRDVTIQQIHYAEESSMVSKRIRVPGGIDRVALDAESYIPAEFGDDEDWIEYHISADDGATWNRVSRVTDDFLGLPEIIAFNDPTPEAFRESGVLYVTTTKPVESLRVKIVLRRPADQNFATPLVRSYSLRIKKK